MQPAGTGADLSRVRRLHPLILCRGRSTPSGPAWLRCDPCRGSSRWLSGSGCGAVGPAALGLLESDRKDLLKCRLGEAQNPLLTRGFFQRGSHGLVVEPARPGLPEASRCFDRVGRGADRSLTMGAAAPSRATAHRPSLVPQSAPALARGVCHIRTVPSAQTDLNPTASH